MYGFCSVIWKWLHFYPPDVYIKQLSRYRAFLQIRRGLAMSKCTCKNLADGTCGTSNFCNGVMVCLLILLHWIVYSCLTKFDSFGEYLSKKKRLDTILIVARTPGWFRLCKLSKIFHLNAAETNGFGNFCDSQKISCALFRVWLEVWSAMSYPFWALALLVILNG